MRRGYDTNKVETTLKDVNKHVAFIPSKLANLCMLVVWDNSIVIRNYSLYYYHILYYIYIVADLGVYSPEWRVRCMHSLCIYVRRQRTDQQ